MKNRIILLILLISIILVLILAVFGLKIGNFEIPSISKLVNRNKEVNANLEKLTQLTSEQYPTQVSKLETSTDDLKKQREKYEEVSGFSADDIDKALESQNYDIVYLWNVIGQYATKNKLKLVMDVKQASGTDLYDLYFTVQGEYVDISTFVTKIENDSDLQFRIYNFNLVPGKSDVDLKATFIIKDISIEGKTLKQSVSASIEDTAAEEENTETSEQDNS